MKWSNVKWIYLSELRDQLRDRRTLFTIAVLPLVLYPLLGMSFLQVAQFSREHATPILVVGSDALPESPALIRDDRFVEPFCDERNARLMNLTVRPHDPHTSQQRLREAFQSSIEEGHFAAVVYFPADFAERLTRIRQDVAAVQARTPVERDGVWNVPQPEIFVNTARDKSRIARDRVEQVLRSWRETIVHENLRQSRIPVAATEPFDVVNTDVAREQSKRAAVWSKILPFVVLIWALTGAFYPAIDLCAGEKERGTLETLLCSPAERSEIVWGKLLTIISFSIATSLLNMLSMGMTGLFIMSRIQEVGGTETGLAMGAPPLSSMGWIFLVLLPVSALFSALSLAIAAFARSSKEGQYYLMPLLLITLPLMLLPMLQSAELDLGTSLIPVTGVMLLLKSLMEGQFLEALRYFVPVMGITAICCWLAIRWAIDQFSDESVLFRESERWGVGLWVHHMVRDRAETPTIAEAIFCGVLLLMIRFFASFMMAMPDSWNGFATSTVVSLIAFIAAPALLMTVMLTRSPRKTLLLRMPRRGALPMAVLLAVVIHPIGMTLGEGVKWLYPFNDDVLTQMEGLGALIGQAPSLWALLAVLAVAPAICEELAFRGFILSGFRHMGHRWGAIVASAVFFGAAHGILQQSLTAAVVGVVIGYIAVQTGSLLPGILFHLVYNSLSLTMAIGVPQWIQEYTVLEWVFFNSADTLSYHLPSVLIGLLLSLGILSWFRSLPFEASAEEELQDALDHQSVQPAAK